MPPTKGTCNICQRTNITIAWRGACGVCSGLMKTGAIDPKSGSMTAEAVDKINELRALAGMAALEAGSGEKKPEDEQGKSQESQDVYLWQPDLSKHKDTPDAAGALSAPERKALLRTANGGIDLETGKIHASGTEMLADATLLSLAIDGQVLPLVPCRNASYDAPALSVHKSGKLLSLVLPGSMPEGCAFAQVFGSPGAEVLGFRLLAERHEGARKLNIKKGHKSLDIHSEGLVRKLGLKPGRYPLEIRGDGILLARLGKGVAS